MVFLVGIATQQIHMHVYLNLGGGNTFYLIINAVSQMSHMNYKRSYINFLITFTKPFQSISLYAH